MNMPAMAGQTRDRKHACSRKERHPRRLGWASEFRTRPRFGRRARPVYLSADLAGWSRRRRPATEATPRRPVRKEPLSIADPGVRDQLVETVLLDLQVERALGNSELFGRQGQIALTRNDGGA